MACINICPKISLYALKQNFAGRKEFQMIGADNAQEKFSPRSKDIEIKKVFRFKSLQHMYPRAMEGPKRFSKIIGNAQGY